MSDWRSGIEWPQVGVQTLTLFLFVFVLLTSCNSKSSKSESEAVDVSFWHFWSEPQQQSVLDSLISQYETLNPSVNVIATPISWSNGKSKLNAAFNSGTQPDVLHLGLDWFSEFLEGGVLSPLLIEGSYHSHAELWVVNARSLVEWTGRAPRYEWGFCISDAHNVIKRTLPLIWKIGAPDFYSSLPISLHMNDALVDALWSLSQIPDNDVLLERSKALDEAFLRGEIHYLYTGSWIIDMASSRDINTFRVVPERSILNGDVLVVAAASGVTQEANSFVSWITDKDQSSTFCRSVSDAGFPSDMELSDSPELNDIEQGFLKTAQISSPLPLSPLLPAIEPVIEEMIEKAYSAKTRSEVGQLVEAARIRVESIERSRPN